MLRPLLVAVLALVLAPSALAVGTTPGVLLGGGGVPGKGGQVRYVALPAEGYTSLAEIYRGKVTRFASFPYAVGIPYATFGGEPAGLSADGTTLVLADATPPTGNLRTSSHFDVVFTNNLSERAAVTLKGDFSYDALSPDGGRLYLIQHVDQTRYVVRAYDVDGHALLPGTIADKSQAGWVMAGIPVARTSGPGGRRVYTLYMRPGGTPFVHALDTVDGVAHCTGVPYVNQNAMFNLRLTLVDGGRTLSIRRPDGKEVVAMDTRTWRLSTPTAAHGSFPWWIVAAAAVAAALVLVLLRTLLRREGPLEARPA